MNIKKPKKVPLIALIIIVVIGVVLSVALLYRNTSKQESTSTPQRSQSDLDQTAKIADKPDNKSLAPNSDKPSSPPSSPEPSGKKNVPMIASANPIGNTVYIRGGLNYPVTEDGTCYVTFTSASGLTIKKDTEILQNPASTDCKTVSASSPEFSKGSWKAVLHFTSTNYEGASDEVSFTIN